MALSLALHGLAFLPLFLIGAAGIASNDEPALLVELSLAAPTAGPAAEASADRPATDSPSPPTEQVLEAPREPIETPPDLIQPPPEQVAAASAEPPTPVAPEPEIRLDLPPPDEVPPPTVTELTPPAPPKPKPAAPRPPLPPAAARPAGQAAVTKAPAPATGDASSTQQASAASSSLVVFEGKPRYRSPPRPPVYPARSIELNQQGEALVRVRLDPDGSAAEIVMWRGTGFPLLDNAALKAVRGWQFLPAMRDGRPVAAWVEIPVRFHLH